MEQLYQLEHNILELLEIGGKAISNSSALPTQKEFKVIQDEYETKVILLLFFKLILSKELKMNTKNKNCF